MWCKGSPVGNCFRGYESEDVRGRVLVFGAWCLPSTVTSVSEVVGGVSSAPGLLLVGVADSSRWVDCWVGRESSGSSSSSSVSVTSLLCSSGSTSLL